MASDTVRVATAAELPGGTQPPREVEPMPAGRVETRPHDGRPAWTNDDAGAVVAATRELGLDLPIDYEHQTEPSKDNRQPGSATAA